MALSPGLLRAPFIPDLQCIGASKWSKLAAASAGALSQLLGPPPKNCAGPARQRIVPAKAGCLACPMITPTAQPAAIVAARSCSGGPWVTLTRLAACFRRKCCNVMLRSASRPFSMVCSPAKLRRSEPATSPRRDSRADSARRGAPRPTHRLVQGETERQKVG